jgi:hypothetical protein
MVLKDHGGVIAERVCDMAGFFFIQYRTPEVGIYTVVLVEEIT